MVNQQKDSDAIRRWLLPLLAFLFLISGCSALIYQLLWLRMLGLIFGVTIWAASTVLAVFMAGLALGSITAGRFADRVRHPVLWFGVLELLISLSALATPTGLRAVEEIYTKVYPMLSNNVGLLTATRIFLTSTILIVPTSLMGASLPIVIRSVLPGGLLGHRVGLLYASNTAGACAGTVLAGFFLLGQVGVRASFGLAGTLNAVVAITAICVWISFLRGPRELVSAAWDSRRSHTGVDALSAASRRLVLGVFTLTGFCSLALEVIWLRLLVSFLEVTTYAFAFMLVSVLTGIAIGSASFPLLLRRSIPRLPLVAGVVMATGLVSLLSLMVLSHSFDTWFTIVGPAGPLEPAQLILAAVVSFLAIFPSAVLMGIAFPMGMHLWVTGDLGQLHQTTNRVGVFYCFNVCGSILGSLAAGFLLLPLLGSRFSLIVVASLSVVAGLALLTAQPRLSKGVLMTFTTGVLATFVAAVVTMPVPVASALQRRFPEQLALHWEEGLQATVAVLRDSSGWRSLYVDGIIQSSDNPAGNRSQRLLGILPVALHHEPKEILVLGLGGGTTTGAASLAPGTNVTVVELAPSVVRAADWFRHVNYDVLRRPNVTLLVGDARNHLLLTSKRYDVIISSVVRPYHASSTNLFSVEFFRLLEKVLRKDGIILQWNGGLTVRQYRLILRTFLRVFPETSLWAGRTMMVGTKQPLKLDAAAFERQLSNPEWRNALESVGIPDYRSLELRQWVEATVLGNYIGTGPIISDDRPYVEYFLSLS